MRDGPESWEYIIKAEIILKELFPGRKVTPGKRERPGRFRDWRHEYRERVDKYGRLSGV